MLRLYRPRAGCAFETTQQQTAKTLTVLFVQGEGCGDDADRNLTPIIGVAGGIVLVVLGDGEATLRSLAMAGKE